MQISKSSETTMVTTPKKPWRYYFMMAFPNSSQIPKSKLGEMLDRTSKIEKKEAEYLQRIAQRNALKTKKISVSPMPNHLFSASEKLCRLLLFLSFGSIFLTWQWLHSKIGCKIGESFKSALYVSETLICFVAIFGLLGLKCRSRGLVLVFTGQILALVVILAAAINEIYSVSYAEERLLAELNYNDGSTEWNEQTIKDILRGGIQSTVAQRLVFDGPAILLSWLGGICLQKRGEKNLFVDSQAFFQGFGNPKTHRCVKKSLRQLSDVHPIALLIIFALETVSIAQGLLLILIILTQKKSLGTTGKAKKDNGGCSVSFLFLSLIMIGILGIGMIAFVTIEWSSCSVFFNGLKSEFTTIGFLGMTNLLLIVAFTCSSRLTFNLVLLVSAIILEIYMFWVTASWVNDIDKMIKTDFKSLPKKLHLKELRIHNVFNVSMKETCTLVKSWMGHICLQPDPDHPMNFEECKADFSGLILRALDFSNSILSLLLACANLLIIILVHPFVLRRIKVIQKWLQRRWNKASKSTKKSNSLWNYPSMQLKDALNLYMSSVRSTDSITRHQHEEAFNTELHKLTGISEKTISPSTVLFQNQYEAIVRTLTIRRLRQQCKLDVSLSLSRDGKTIFVKIFASDNLLMSTLCQLKLKLQLADYIDPGLQFWKDPLEIKDDEKVLDSHTAKQKLKWLLINHKISRKEADIFSDESLIKASARINAHIRNSRMIDGTLAARNLYPAFAEYSPKPSLQFLYKRYFNRLDLPSNIRRSSVLRTIDCLQITRAIIEHEFDTNIMINNGIIIAFNSLHAASSFDHISLKSLYDSWVTFWRPRHLPGEYDPDRHWVRNLLGRMNLLRQPLQDIRDYFGESIGFYFAWAGYYSQMILFAAISVIFIATAVPSSSDPATLRSLTFDDESEISTTKVLISIFVLLWGFLCLKMWSRKSIWIQMQWGCLDSQMETQVRTQFRGVERRNPVTLEKELYLPGRQKIKLQLISCIAVLLLAIGIVFLSTVLLLGCTMYASRIVGLHRGILIGSIIQAIVIQLNGEFISQISHTLTQWENYRIVSEFERSVIIKVFILQAVNTYSSLFILAFVKLKNLGLLFGSLYEAYHSEVGQINGFAHIQTLLLAIFGVRIIFHLIFLLYNALTKRTRDFSRKVESDDVESELSLEMYAGSYKDYTELVAQFGLVIMFTGISPFAPILAFLECVIKLRLDAMHLCLFTRRAIGEPVQSIRYWSKCMHVLLKLGILTNIGILLFAADNFSSLSTVERTSLFLYYSVVGFLLYEIFWFIIPDISPTASVIQARNRFVIDRYFKSNALHAQLEPSDDDLDTSFHSTSIHDSLQLHQERCKLLTRLNFSLNKRDDLETISRADSNEKSTQKHISETKKDDDIQPTVEAFITEKTTCAEFQHFSTLELSGIDAIQEATRRDGFDFKNEADWTKSQEMQTTFETMDFTASSAISISEHSFSTTTLSGAAAVREAIRRSDGMNEFP